MFILQLPGVHDHRLQYVGHNASLELAHSRRKACCGTAMEASIAAADFLNAGPAVWALNGCQAKDTEDGSEDGIDASASKSTLEGDQPVPGSQFVPANQPRLKQCGEIWDDVDADSRPSKRALLDAARPGDSSSAGRFFNGYIGYATYLGDTIEVTGWVTGCASGHAFASPNVYWLSAGGVSGGGRVGYCNEVCDFLWS